MARIDGAPDNGCQGFKAAVTRRIQDKRAKAAKKDKKVVEIKSQETAA
jgi:hypothetical protein